MTTPAPPSPPEPPPPAALAAGGVVPSRQSLRWAMAGVAATVILVALDSTIVTTTLPRVARALDGMALYAWVGTGYLLTTAASILVFGRLGDLFGRKALMLASIAIIAAGSVLCGLAQSMAQLIAFRIFQGIGGGMMIATAFAAPADLFPDARERVRRMAMVSMAFAVASGVGPVLGGAITEHFDWRAAFFVNPLVAAVAFLLLVRHFPKLRPAGQSVPTGLSGQVSQPGQSSQRLPRQQVDWLGAALLVVAISAPLAALELAFATGSHAHPGLALLLAVAGAGAVAVLIPYERRHASPMFPLRVLKTRQSQLLNVISVAVGAVMYTLIFYTPLLLQHELHYTPSQTGLLLTPLVVGIPTGSLINGRLFPLQSEPQRLVVLGAALLTVGCVLLLALGESAPPWRIVLAFFFCGLGLGFLMPNLTLFMQMLAERRDVGVASALVQTTRAVGSAAGTAAVGVVIAYTSVLAGVRIGLALCVGLSLACALLAARIKMKNLAA